MDISSLHKFGYILIPQLLTNYELSLFEKSIVDNQLVDYNRLKEFIDYHLLGQVNNVLDWDAVYIKFRFSCRTHSNLKDASNFHGDVYNFTDNKIIPVFTALCNLDSSTLQVIPSSHIKGASFDKLKNVKTLQINPGDVLIFHSNLFHRGISNDNNRRLLQVFDIFPNPQYLEQYLDKMISVQTNQLQTMKLLNKFNQNLIQSSHINNTNLTLFDKFHYWLLYHHLQYKVLGIDVPHQYKNGYIVGYLAGTKDTIQNSPQPWNVNIIVIPHKMVDPDTTGQNIFLFVLISIILYCSYRKFNYRP
jgi:hypothetical protein